MVRKSSLGLTIGALAKATGVGVETVRFYQRRGLVDTPASVEGYRRYGPGHERRIRFIRQAQSLGFTLEDIGSLLGLDEEKDHQVARSMAREKSPSSKRVSTSWRALPRRCASWCIHANTPATCPARSFA